MLLMRASSVQGSTSGTPSFEQSLGWSANGSLLTNTVNGTLVLNNTPNQQGQNGADNDYNSSGNTTGLTNAAGDAVVAKYDAWDRPVEYKVTQQVQIGIDPETGAPIFATYTLTETIQYDALGRVLNKCIYGKLPDGTAVQTQHTYGYNALTGQVLTDTNTTDYNEYVYAPNGALVLRATGPQSTLSDPQILYALTDPSGTVIAIADASGNVVERYVYDALGNAQAMQANGQAYGTTTNSTGKNDNWKIQQRFSGSTFNTTTHELTAGGSQYGWNTFRPGQSYDAVPGLYMASSGRAYNPRQASMMTPDYSGILQGYNAYDATNDWLDRNAQLVYNGGAALASVAVGIGASIFTTPLGGIAAGVATYAALSGTWRHEVENQSLGASALGGVGDATGFGSLYAGINNQDFGTFNDLHLSTEQRLLFGALGAFQIVTFGIGVAGALGRTTAAFGQSFATGAEWAELLACRYGAANVRWVSSAGAKTLRAGHSVGLGTRIAKFFYDSRSYRSISKEYWAANGPADGSSLHHWLFPQRATAVPQGIRNAGFNLIELPALRSWTGSSLGLNQWMGFAPRWDRVSAFKALSTEWTIRVGIPGSLVGGAYIGYEGGVYLNKELNGGGRE